MQRLEVLKWAVTVGSSPGLQSSTVAQLHCLRVDNFISSSTKNSPVAQKHNHTLSPESPSPRGRREKKKKTPGRRRSDRGVFTASYPCEWRRRRRTRRVGPGRPRPGGSSSSSSHRHQLASVAARRQGGRGGAANFIFQKLNYIKINKGGN